MRFLIAGIGSIGRRHLRNLRALGETDILFLRSKPTPASDSELAGFPTFINMEEAFHAKPDAIIICNPTALHMAVAIPGAKAGCHLMIEKPLAGFSAELFPLLPIVEQNNVKVLSAFQFRFHPGLRKIRSLLDSNVIGNVLQADCCWGEYLPGWHPWEDYRTGYSARTDLGGGVVRTLCHPLDYLRWLMGEPENVQAQVAKRSGLEIDVEDEAEILINFKTGSAARVHLDYYRQPAKHSLEICGTNGVISWDNADGVVLVQNTNGNTEHYPVAAGFERNTMFLDEMRHFLRVLHGDEEPICTLDDGVKAQLVIDAVYESARICTPIKINGLPS